MSSFLFRLPEAIKLNPYQNFVYFVGPLSHEVTPEAFKQHVKSSLVDGVHWPSARHICRLEGPCVHGRRCRRPAST